MRIRNDLTNIATCCLALSLWSACVREVDEETEQDSVAPVTEALRHGPTHLRAFIAEQVGGLDKLKVPANDSSIPLPPADPKRPGRYATTEAKRQRNLSTDEITLLSGQGAP